MYKSSLIAPRILFKDIDINLEDSIIDTIDSDFREIDKYPDT